jgi:hypothetical protein
LAISTRPSKSSTRIPPGDSRSTRARKLLLFLQPDALIAERVDHAVVDAHEPIDAGLAHLPVARHQVAVLEQLCAVADEVERGEEAVDQEQAGGERRDENGFRGEQPPGVGANQPDRGPRQQAVDDNEVEDELRPEGHPGISYFSNRR